ncbi:HIT family protein [Clostridium sp. Marseille-QA1073]
MIKDILNKEWQCKCIGCSIALGEIMPPGGIIAETNNFILHQDPEIPIKAFLIIASKRHIKSISQLSYEESQELFDLVYKVRVALKSIEDINEISIIQEERSGHFHIWLLPRYEWMNDKFENSLSAVRDIMNYTRNNYKTEKNISEVLETVDLIKDSLKYLKQYKR